MTLKLEVGKTYVDGAGRKVQIVYKSAIPRRMYSFLGISILSPTEELAVYYGESGSQGGAEKFDLVKEYVQPDYRWFNLYTESTGRYQPSIDEARTSRNKDLEFISTYRVDLETGDITKVEV